MDEAILAELRAAHVSRIELGDGRTEHHCRVCGSEWYDGGDKPESSPDTDYVRDLSTVIMGRCHDAEIEKAMLETAYALDSTRAECERLRVKCAALDTVIRQQNGEIATYQRMIHEQSVELDRLSYDAKDGGNAE